MTDDDERVAGVDEAPARLRGNRYSVQQRRDRLPRRHQLHLDAGDPERARASFLKAREQTESPAQQHLLDRKLRRTMN